MATMRSSAALVPHEAVLATMAAEMSPKATVCFFT
jgi:hypothetical protein